MQKRLKERAIGLKREFLKVRVRGKEITLTYRLPWVPASVSKFIDNHGKAQRAAVERFELCDILR